MPYIYNSRNYFGFIADCTVWHIVIDIYNSRNYFGFIALNPGVTIEENLQ